MVSPLSSPRNRESGHILCTAWKSGRVSPTWVHGPRVGKGAILYGTARCSGQDGDRQPAEVRQSHGALLCPPSPCSAVASGHLLTRPALLLPLDVLALRTPFPTPTRSTRAGVRAPGWVTLFLTRRKPCQRKFFPRPHCWVPGRDCPLSGATSEASPGGTTPQGWAPCCQLPTRDFFLLLWSCDFAGL